jgi:hypothetical protein
VNALGDVFLADSGKGRVPELSLPTAPATPSPLTGYQAMPVATAVTGLAPATVNYDRAADYRVVATGPPVPGALTRHFTCFRGCPLTGRPQVHQRTSALFTRMPHSRKR